MTSAASLRIVWILKDPSPQHADVLRSTLQQLACAACHLLITQKAHDQRQHMTIACGGRHYVTAGRMYVRFRSVQ